MEPIKEVVTAAADECIQKDKIDKESPKNKEETPAEDSKKGKPTELEQKIIRQIQYYFSDLNLQRDPFLRKQMKSDPEGWVPLSKICSFKRVLALTGDMETVVNALLKTDDCLIEVSADRQKIRRHPSNPLTKFNKAKRDEATTRTIYIEGFSLKMKTSDVLEFLEPYKEVVHVKMVKSKRNNLTNYTYKKRRFTGNVFVTFAKKEQAQEFMDRDSVIYNGLELVRMWQEKYFQIQQEAIDAVTWKNDYKDDVVLPKGCVIYFEGATDDVTREILRESMLAVDNNVEIAYLDFTNGEKYGHIRLAFENSAIQFMEKLREGKLILTNNVQLKFYLLKGKQEKTYLQKTISYIKIRRSLQNSPRKLPYTEEDTHAQPKSKIPKQQ